MKKQKDKWRELARLIQAYADAQEADSWKGGGDPADTLVIEAQLQLARVQLTAHVEKMRRELES